jgi:hypothetical protein
MSPPNGLKIVQVIRKYPARNRAVQCRRRQAPRPRTRLQNDAGCLFLHGLAKIETFNSDGSPQEKWRPAAIYSYIQDKQLEPDFRGGYLCPWVENKKWRPFLLSDPSSGTPGEEAPNTPISGKDFLDFMYAKMRVFGRSIGADYAEGFICTRTPGVSDSARSEIKS